MADEIVPEDHPNEGNKCQRILCSKGFVSFLAFALFVCVYAAGLSLYRWWPIWIPIFFFVLGLCFFLLAVLIVSAKYTVPTWLERVCNRLSGFFQRRTLNNDDGAVGNQPTRLNNEPVDSMPDLRTSPSSSSATLPAQQIADTMLSNLSSTSAQKESRETQDEAKETAEPQVLETLSRSSQSRETRPMCETDIPSPVLNQTSIEQSTSSTSEEETSGQL